MRLVQASPFEIATYRGIDAIPDPVGAGNREAAGLIKKITGAVGAETSAWESPAHVSAVSFSHVCLTTLGAL
jgi:hypothetical protein